MKAKNFFSDNDKERIVEAIAEAEKNTSGEVRVHVEWKCNGEPLDRAANLFALLKMHKTKLRNGVLIYLSINDRKFAIIGDAGINAKVSEDFWESTKDKMLDHFKENRLTDGLVAGILSTGEQLKSHFPYQSDDVNELPNDISFG